MLINKVTIAAVIPTYNRAHCIGKAVESVLGQSTPVDEVIVVDDGSTDDTSSVLARYGEQITVIRQMNCGVSAARNAGIAAATTDWIAFLDSDDTWRPDYLEMLRGHVFAQHPEARAVVSNVLIWFNDEYQEDLFALRGFQCDQELSVYRNGFECLQIASTPGVAFRREDLSAAGGFAEDLSIYEDYELFVKLVDSGIWVANARIAADVLRVGDPTESLSWQHQVDRQKSVDAKLRGLLRLSRCTTLTTAQRRLADQELSHWRFLAAIEAKRAGEHQRCWRLLAQSVLDRPTMKSAAKTLIAVLPGGHRRWHGGVSRRSGRRSDFDAARLTAHNTR